MTCQTCNVDWDTVTYKTPHWVPLGAGGKAKKEKKKKLFFFSCSSKTVAANQKANFTRAGEWYERGRTRQRGSWLAAGITPRRKLGSGNKGVEMHPVFGRICLPHCARSLPLPALVDSSSVLSLRLCVSAKRACQLLYLLDVIKVFFYCISVIFTCLEMWSFYWPDLRGPLKKKNTPLMRTLCEAERQKKKKRVRDGRNILRCWKGCALKRDLFFSFWFSLPLICLSETLWF